MRFNGRGTQDIQMVVSEGYADRVGPGRDGLHQGKVVPLALQKLNRFRPEIYNRDQIALRLDSARIATSTALTVRRDDLD